jgi:hypothetical protein
VKACFRPLVVGLCLAMIFVAELSAQEPRPAPSPAAEGAAIAQQARQRDLAAIMPLKVRVVLSKYQGDKKISSLPYELTVRTDNVPSNIRMNTQVPVLTFGSPAPGSDAGGKPAPKIGPFRYRDVGTNIDARAVNLDPGRYAITVAIDDSSIYKDERRTAGTSQVEDVVAIRSYRTQNSTILRDGQSTEFTVASDKMTGEVMKAEVSISVIK